jgi:hypothetical protein
MGDCNRRRLPTLRREQSAGRIKEVKKGHKKGHETVPFWVLDGFSEIGLTLLERMAGTTRLELATSAVTGQRSNQLNYVPAKGLAHGWWAVSDLNG